MSAPDYGADAFAGHGLTEAELRARQTRVIQGRLRALLWQLPRGAEIVIPDVAANDSTDK